MADEARNHDVRPDCKYGTKCYQKNPEHHKKYNHPGKVFKQDVKIKNKHKQRFSPYFKNVKPNVEKDSTKKCDNSKAVVESSTSNRKENECVSEDSVKLTVKLPKDLEYHDKNENPKIFKELFLVAMPPDFFKFFECLKEEDDDVEKLLAKINLQLIGPYDILLGTLPKLEETELYLIHWRFFYDPPEFQAVLKMKGSSQYHIGYYRDDPNEKPLFMASNDSSKDCHLSPMADNIFGSVYKYLEIEKKRSPFTSITCQKFMEKVKQWAEKHNYPIEEYNMKRRLSQVVTRTLHGAGIVVPFNKKTELGYRKLTETDANLKKLFAKLAVTNIQSERDQILSELQPVITYANIAVDECDFGTGLECGLDLFCSGLKELEPSALGSLSAAYTLLHRDVFSKIIQVHLKYRRKGPDMSLLSLCED